jgi:hypothetical protein
MRKSVVLAMLCLVVVAAVASATTVAYVPLRKAIRMSDAVVVGYVLSTESVYNREGEIVTKVNVLVEEAMKGGVQAGEIVSFHAWGGSLDGVNVEAVGEARYQLGEKVLLQLEDIDGEYHTLGLSFGKWNVVRDKAGVEWAVRNLSDLHMVGVDESPVVKMPLGQMRSVARQVERLSF